MGKSNKVREKYRTSASCLKFKTHKRNLTKTIKKNIHRGKLLNLSRSSFLLIARERMTVIGKECQMLQNHTHAQWLIYHTHTHTPSHTYTHMLPGCYRDAVYWPRQPRRASAPTFGTQPTSHKQDTHTQNTHTHAHRHKQTHNPAKDRSMETVQRRISRIRREGGAKSFAAFKSALRR